MFRNVVVTCVLSCFLTSASAQTLPNAQQAPTPATKPPVKKPAAKAAAKSAAPVDAGPCRIGVISAFGDQFSVQKIGIMVFGNDLAEAPIDAWGLDDIVVARLRAMPPGTGVRKIGYAKTAFLPYYKPASIFRNPQDDLTAIVREIAANANCERYLVVTRISVKDDGGTNQILNGVGVVQRGAGPFTRTNLFAAFQITVFDGRTFQIHRRPIDFGAILAKGLLPQKEPLSELENESFPASATEAAASPMLRDRMRAYVASLVDKMLPAYLKDE